MDWIVTARHYEWPLPWLYFFDLTPATGTCSDTAPHHEGARRLRRALIKREIHVGRVEQQLDVAGRAKAALGLEGAGGSVVRFRVGERVVVLRVNKERRRDETIGFYQLSRSIHRNIGDSSFFQR